VKILVLGSGGREHAIVWKLKRNGHEIFCAPGNAGICEIATCMALNPEDIAGIADCARQNRFDLTVVGPEAPLVAGIADEFARQRLAIFGPNRTAAQLEGSKAFAKSLMQECGIPTARFETFTDARPALAYVASQEYPLVIKASGLALGKGAVIVRSKAEARDIVAQMLMRKAFGAAGETVIVEEYLHGEEASIIGISDGDQVIFLEPSQDHKALLDGDKGPNTGGMGAYAPAPIVTPELQAAVEQRVFAPLLKGLKRRGIEYRGVIYAGIMVTDQGPQVLEFNCRFGDPETQAILPLFEGDLGELMLAAATGRIRTQDTGAPPPAPGIRTPEVSVPPKAAPWRKAPGDTSRGNVSASRGKNREQGYALCVVAASGGYPGSYEKGKPIRGELGEREDVIVFHAGTRQQDKRIVTSGGRVLGITGLGRTLAGAKATAYSALARIHFDGMQYRRDIGDKGIRRQAAHE
jgi:phosphoribosylamine--glycine ligase